jgi:ribosome maturation factor RimP
VALQDIAQQTVSGLGYDLVEIDRSAGGLLRITIDLPWTPSGAEQFVTVEDCEKVTRQLQFALEVEGIEYRRLEVSSPGIDRPLRHEKDFERFVGQVVDITLKQAIGASAGAGASAGSGVSAEASASSSRVAVSANRKKFRGKLERAEAQTGWQIVWSDEPAAKPGQRISKKRALPPLQALAFVLDEVREARLAPIVSFKGRGQPEGE